MSFRKINRFYMSYANHWKEVHEKKSKESVIQRMHIVLDSLKNRPAQKILDAGCGGGQFAHLARSLGHHCDGMDLSEEMLRIANEGQLDSTKGSFWRGNLENPEDYLKLKYDAISAFGVFVHDIDEEKVLRNFHSRLKKKGSAFISFRNSLFGLFTLNECAKPFYENLLEPLPLTKSQRRDSIKYFEKALIYKYNRHKDKKDFNKVFSKFHNPYEIGELVEKANFQLKKIHFLNFHAAPPIVIEKHKKLGAMESVVASALSNTCRAAFLASSFLIEIVPL